MKHIYCILAHKDFFLLKTLILCLDSEESIMIVHLDKKCPMEFRLKVQELRTELNLKGILKVIKKEASVEVSWMGRSMVEAEFVLFKAAKDILINYPAEFADSWVHLISGQDLPLKSQKEIQQYFNRTSRLVKYDALTDAVNRADLRNKVLYYHLWTEDLLKGSKFKRKIKDFIRRVFIFLQKVSGYKRVSSYAFSKVRKGSQWFSAKGSVITELLSYESQLPAWKGVSGLDEIFFQTYLWSLGFAPINYNPVSGVTGALRKIDWTRGEPYTWRSEDFKELIGSQAMFARKFNSEKDKEIIYRIGKFVLRQ